MIALRRVLSVFRPCCLVEYYPVLHCQSSTVLGETTEQQVSRDGTDNSSKHRRRLTDASQITTLR